MLDVVEPAAADILASHTVPLSEHEAKRKPDDQYRAFVQQIKLGSQVFLVYRSFWGEPRTGIARVPAFDSRSCRGKWT